MDNRLKNYSAQPDPEVWNKIRKTLRRQEFRRQAIGGAIGTVIAVAAIVTVVLWPYDTKPTATQEALPQMAQVTAAPTPASPAEEAMATAPVQAQEQQPATQPVATQPAMKNETALQPHTAPVVAESQPAAVQQPAEAVAEVRSIEAKKAAAVETPAAKQEQAAAKADVQPAAKETNLPENAPAAPAVKSQVNSGVIGDTILWVPNAFAPSSDNPDITTFRARLNKTDASILNYRISIFNRQGHQVFQSNDINQAWDGTYKGRTLPQGGYVYVIYYVDKDGLTHQRKGTVALIR